MASRKPREKPQLILRPSVLNRVQWFQEAPDKQRYGQKLSEQIKERDNFTCAGCGHRAVKYMNVHHLVEGGDDSPDNLVTLCVACHAVLNIGRNLSLETIEIWESTIAQVEIVRRTREGVRQGLTLAQVNAPFGLTKGPHNPKSINYAKKLLLGIGQKQIRVYLPEPLCVVFTDFKQWQWQLE
jgi:5-methylcytosine-specific restriction endonuclease McrA